MFICVRWLDVHTYTVVPVTPVISSAVTIIMGSAKSVIFVHIECLRYHPVSVSFSLYVICVRQLGVHTYTVVPVTLVISSAVTITDLPIHPYLTVLVQKWAGSTDVCPYFSKCRHWVSRKYVNCDVNECEFVASEVDRRAIMGSYCSLIFAYFKPFLELKYTVSPDWSKKFVKPVNFGFASHRLKRSWHLCPRQACTIHKEGMWLPPWLD